ncbi:Crp/Fnr family transcriptional regulator [Geoalkalibacter sp.]|uniref:Crp/Fnr family transcriptional regulator n=1 Tax=Geoalkalibacter sp. TaxID=3041440 RepID=UPI00272E83C4|nr:Crp/Fnr family transcriptional regulator [Geoalkalibacter sp.]
MEPRLWYIRNADMFSWLREEEQMELAGRSEMVSCKRNNRFFFAEEPSDNIFLVKQGRVKLIRSSPEGREIILDILGPGEIFGELALAGEERRSHSAEALDDALVCIIAREDFEDLLRRHPEMALRVLKLVGLRRRELEMRLEDLVFRPLAGRLAITLLWQAQRLGVTEDDGSIRIPLSQKDLAYLIGASREAVAEQLSEMKRLGLVRTSYRTIRIADRAALKNFLKRYSNN